MIEIFERHGEWREKEARRLLSSPASGLSVISPEELSSTLNRNMYKPGKEIVQYWGFVRLSFFGADNKKLIESEVIRFDPRRHNLSNVP